jgi:peroxiredoxin
MKSVLQFVILTGWFFLLPVGAAEPGAGGKLIGTPAQPWKMTNWLNSTGVELKDLKGKVVLVRWWTAPECSYCRATAPALNEFYDKYHSQDFELLGFYHHKSSTPLRVEEVKKYAGLYGFRFPVAIDPEWRTLHRWWLDQGNQQWTSVSFLIDKKGVIRYIHPGGQYVKGDEDYKLMKAKIEELLKEK